MSRINDRELGHADESDGIEEYDNPLPDWWLGMFFLCILWSLVYGVHWHFIAENSQEKLYLAEVAQAEVQYPQLLQGAGFDDSAETLALGEEVYTSTCASCHAATMTGGIGPSLIDDVWIHGDAFEDVSHTITEGVAAKGMPSWGPILGPKKVAAVASFILSKVGSAPAEASEAGVVDATPSGAAGDPPAEASEASEAVVDGAAVFATNCVACHKADLTGGIGPSLVDDVWVHGGTLEEIRHTIEVGVPTKGMITWKGILTDAQIDAVAQYVFEASAAK